MKKTIFIPFLFFYLLSPALQAQSLKLDPSFGIGGIWNSNVSLARNILVLPSNEILLCGETENDNFEPTDGLVVKLRSKGVEDSLFGVNGIKTVDFKDLLNENLLLENFSSLILLKDGRIACAGQKSTFFPSSGAKTILAVLNPDGKIDSSFGNAGRQLYDYPGFSADETGVLPYSGGDMLLWAFVRPMGVLTDSLLLAITRVHPDGSLDLNFGDTASAGRALRELSPADPFFKSVPPTQICMGPDDKILVGGSSGVFECSVTRFNPDGSRDQSFGVNGQSVISAGFDPTIFDMRCRPDGKILMVGSSRLAGDPVFTVIRLNADGSADETWGDNGVLIRDMSEYDNMLFTAAFQTDGKVLALGNRINGNGETETVFVRFLPDGGLDSAFADNGVQILDIGSYYSSLQQIKIAEDHAIYVLGGTETITLDTRFLAKYLPDDYTKTQTPSFGHILNARVLPNPVSAGQTVQLEVAFPDESWLYVALIDTQGRTLQNWQEEAIQGGTAKKTLALRSDLPSGIYRLHLTTKNAAITLPVALK